MSENAPGAATHSGSGPGRLNDAEAERYLYRLIADSSSDWEYLEDPDGLMLWVSPSCEPITGHSPDEYLEHPDLLLAIVHPEDRALFEAHRSECRLSEEGDEAEFRIVRPDGGIRWFGHRCRPMNLPGGTSVGRRCSNREITERKKSEGELLRLNRTLRALSNSSQALNRANSESDLLEHVCQIVVEDCGHAMVWIGYAEEDEGKTVRPVAHAGFDQGLLDTLNVTWADKERGHGPTGTAIRTGKPAKCRNMLTDPGFAPWREEALERGYASSIVLPLKTEGKTFGAITIYSKEPDPFSNDEVKLLAELADDLSYGIAAIRLRAAHGRAEETLRQSEERYRSLFENMLDGFAYCEMLFENGRPRDFKYLAVNRAFETLTGLKNVVGKTATEVIPGIWESHPELFETYGRVAGTGKSERFEIHLQPLGLWFSISVYSNEEGYFTAVFDNITERKRAEEQLQLHLTALQSTANAIVITGADGTIEWVNAAFESLTGYSAAEVTGKNPRFLKSGRQAVAFYQDLWETILAGRVWHGEVVNKRKDGSLYTEEMTITPVSDAGGTITQFVAIKQDVTERKQGESALRQSEERLRLAQQVARIGTFEQNLKTGETLWTPELEAMHGLPPGGFPGTLEAWEKTIHPSDRPSVMRKVTEAAEKGGFEAEWRVVWPNGLVRWLFGSASVFRDASGKPDRMIGVHIDITERKQVEERLRELNETLEKRVAERTAEAERRAVQLRALASELSQTEQKERRRLAKVLHDHLQQVLVAAKLNIDAMQGQLLQDELRSLASEVNELLDQSIAECRSLTVALSPPILQEAGLAGGLGWLARRMKEQHGLEVDLSIGDDWVEPVDGDLKTFLFEAVRELLFNVVKHSGVLAARVALGRADGRGEVRIEDDGKGFEPKIRPGVQHDETGFGLFFIRERLDMMGAELLVDSAPGRGTRVTLRTPAGPVSETSSVPAAAAASAIRDDVKEVETTAVRPASIRVVIADDHRIFRQGLIALIRAESGIDVVGEAADGAEAVELARSLRPDVIIMDVSMPKMNGIEATRQITTELPGIRIVGLSMHEDEEIAAAMRAAGAVDFVTKGGRSDALIEAIRAACLANPVGRRDD